MHRARVPEVATPRTMATTIAVFYAVGGSAGLLVTLGGGTTGAARWSMVAIVLVALSSAPVVLRWGQRWPRWTFHLLVVSAAALVDAAVLLSPGPDIALAVATMTSFLVFDAYLFFSLRAGTVHLVAVLVGVVTALTLREDVGLPAALALGMVMTALGAVTRRLVLRASGATRDALTDLHNRRGLDQALQDAVARADRSGEPLAAALFDLDGFKQVNDTQGHEAGDAVLRQVADVWRRALPRPVVLARHGGDEFAVLLPGRRGPEALDVLRRVRADHPDLQLSGGVAEHVGGESGAQLMRRADTALYAAKAAGRGRFELEGGEVSAISRELAAAVAAGDLRVHLQPVVAFADGEVVGVEALARWDRPGHGPVPPDQFIEVAERHGLMGPLGEHVLRTACQALADLHARSGRRLRLGVNVSGQELCDPDYPARVRAVLAATGWPATETVLEVTESTLDGQSATAVAALGALRAEGVVVALDDFGTGYSSISRLDTLPVDILKVDASFTATVASSPRRAQLMRSLVALADSLGLDVVAEGVETAEQHALVRDVGCRFGQGWLFGRPLPPEQFPVYLGAPDRAPLEV
ncbi:hypothetical protein GCM10011381_08830 [Klenkia taihuensis]|uniref:Diguanylate cyclase/phosphodiesterase n=2 Tax=Klenkia taihuensis TaxID=1225127 RepID=A0A1I1Q426_9ACTN|nr:hypothetical protein GCM10011381_08830 [Klenkia taihuensis]SFD14618.1 diguanylate cyclase/phosphodiesterase [Klenkia taihuensis]